jgi:guanylate kinase
MDNSKINNNGFMLILSSPSGAGKTTLTRKLLETDDSLVLSVSATTRSKRTNEEDGKDYHFISHAEFAAMVRSDEFLEHATVFTNYYGTPKKPVQEVLKKGKNVLFDIDWQGARQLISKEQNNVVTIFILPPSMEELNRRLHNRGLDSEEVVQQRMTKAKSEISHFNEYDYVIINDDLNESLARIREIISAEKQKRTRQIQLPEFVKTLLK